MSLEGSDTGRSGIVGEPPQGGDRPGGLRERRGGTIKAGFYLFTLVLAGWVFAYGSGLFPWLGYARIDERSTPGVTTRVGNLDFGPGTMLLFEGQTAFYEFDSTDIQGDITFDVKPLTVLGYSRAMKRVKGARNGRLEFPIARTGLYNFEHEPALGRRYGRTAYSVKWGAR